MWQTARMAAAHERISVRLRAEDMAELTELCEKYEQQRSEVVRIALRLGMIAIRKDPTTLVRTPPPGSVDRLRSKRDR